MFCVGLFLACMFCHGELVRLKPAPRYLTRFYLMISLGGAVGAALVGIVAPLVLPAYFELGGGLVALRAAAAVAGAPRPRRCSACSGLVVAVRDDRLRDLGVRRVLRRHDRRDAQLLRRAARAGDRRRRVADSAVADPRHDHARQRSTSTRRCDAQPTTYYTATSGIGRLLESLHPRTEPLKVGVIGLGTGTLAAYGAQGRRLPLLRHQSRRDRDRAARLHLSSSDSDATIETPLGDARLSLEREPPQSFDVLAIDAFSSDAIPVHLITAEALAIYLRHMKPGGVIAFHVTNRFLDLVPVVEALAHAHGLHALWIADDGEDALGEPQRLGAAVATDPRALDAARDSRRPRRRSSARRDWRLWTDDFNNLVQVLK